MTDKMREEFEAWHRSKFGTKYSSGQPTRDMHNGVYDEKYGPEEQQERWEIWQTSREAMMNMERIGWINPSALGVHEAVGWVHVFAAKGDCESAIPVYVPADLKVKS